MQIGRWQFKVNKYSKLIHYNSMNPVVSNVWCCDNFQLRLQFSNGEERMFDCTPYLDKGVFTALTDPAIFATAKVVAGSVEWDGEIDLSYDTLYRESTTNKLVGLKQVVH